MAIKKYGSAKVKLGYTCHFDKKDIEGEKFSPQSLTGYHDESVTYRLA
jgi:hypothetical protein